MNRVEARFEEIVRFCCIVIVTIQPCTGLLGTPSRSGKLKDLTKFDASFFGVHPKQANTMDPQLRLLMEVTYEAILDAGALLIFDFVFVNNYTFVSVRLTTDFSCVGE